MRKTTRLLKIIQLLRQASRPLLAREIAEELEVSKRTVYRDIAALQAMRTPIVGEPGVGYVMRKGYDLPPINFDTNEAEAVAVGLSLVARTGDIDLWQAARRAFRKLNDAAPGVRRLLASSWGVEAAPAVEMADLRAAIRREKKIRIAYEDANGEGTRRIVWPLVLIYYIDAAMLVGWCELRDDLRHFRVDRMSACEFLSDSFEGAGDALISRWEATLKEDTVLTKDL